MAKKERVTLELKFRVTYLPKGTSEKELRDGLVSLVETGLGNGLLTSDTPAEVDTHSYDITLIPQPVKVKKPKGRFHEGTFSAFAHRVSFFYRLPARKRISQEELEALTAAAMDRVEECICNGYVQGELNYETERLQATGWWRIDNE